MTVFHLGPQFLLLQLKEIPIWSLFYFLSSWIHEGHNWFVCLFGCFFFQDSGDIHFLASVQDWYNPFNWQDIASLASSIILHTDNVPCVHDTAVFPQVIIIKALSQLTLSIQCMKFEYPYQFSWKHNLYNGNRQLSLCFTSKFALPFEWKIKHVYPKSDLFARLNRYLI